MISEHYPGIFKIQYIFTTIIINLLLYDASSSVLEHQFGMPNCYSRIKSPSQINVGKCLVNSVFLILSTRYLRAYTRRDTVGSNSKPYSTSECIFLGVSEGLCTTEHILGKTA